MDLEIRWDDQQPGVIIMQYGQVATWDELFEFFETQGNMAAQVSHPVAVIVLRQEAIHLPGGDWMAAAQHIRRSQPPNVKVWIGVGLNRTVQAVVEVARRAGIINAYNAASIEAAREIAATALAEVEADASHQPQHT